MDCVVGKSREELLQGVQGASIGERNDGDLSLGSGSKVGKKWGSQEILRM